MRIWVIAIMFDRLSVFRLQVIYTGGLHIDQPSLMVGWMGIPFIDWCLAIASCAVRHVDR